MSKYRKRSELARFLSVPPEEINRMMEEDNLPHRRLPGKNKPTIRFRLYDVWEWLKKWTPGGKIESYADFVREFDEAQQIEVARMSDEKGGEL
jgi:hypothetical protein